MSDLNQLDLTKGVIAFDLETTSLDRWSTKILAATFSDGITDVVLTEDFEQMIPLLENPDIVKVIHNAKFDIGVVMASLDCTVVNVWDTQIMHILMNMGRKRGVDFFAGLQSILQECLGIFIDKSIRETFIDHSGEELTAEQIAYAAKDANVLIPLYHYQVDKIQHMSLDTAARLENTIVPVVTRMEMTGIRFDRDHWATCHQWLGTGMSDLSLRIAEQYGIRYQRDIFNNRVKLAVNLKSNPQILELIRSFGIPITSTGKDALVKVSKRYPKIGGLVRDIIEYRHLSTLREKGYDTLLNHRTGRMTSLFDQVGTRTGRFSSYGDSRLIPGRKVGTNLQNVRNPERGTALGEPNFRNCFIPDPGHSFVIFDYSKQEIAVLASLSGDERLIAGLSSEDIYETFAVELGVDRQTAKTGVLAVFYGASGKGLAVRLGLPVDATEAFITKVRKMYPRAAEWADARHKQALQQGFVRTASGRMRHFDNPVFYKGRSLYRAATNTPVQGTGADMFKLALMMMHIRRADIYTDTTIDIFSNFEGPVILLHDEIGIQVKDEVAEDAAVVIKDCMIKAAERVCPGVPARVDGGVSKSWSH